MTTAGLWLFHCKDNKASKYFYHGAVQNPTLEEEETNRKNNILVYITTHSLMEIPGSLTPNRKEIFLHAESLDG